MLIEFFQLVLNEYCLDGLSWIIVTVDVVATFYYDFEFIWFDFYLILLEWFAFYHYFVFANTVNEVLLEESSISYNGFIQKVIPFLLNATQFFHVPSFKTYLLVIHWTALLHVPCINLTFRFLIVLL